MAGWPAPTIPSTHETRRSRLLPSIRYAAARAAWALAGAALLASILPVTALAQGFHAVFSRDGVDAWAVGDGGTYYRTLDAGVLWGSGSLGTTRLRDVTSHGLTVLVVGDGGRIWRSVNSGGSFAMTVAAGAPDLRSISMPDAATAFVVGASGTILKTSDGGASWTPQISGTTARLNAVHFEDELYGWVAGENGTVLSTTNGGEDWTAVTVGTTRELYGVAKKGSRVWVVGARGTALRSVNGGVSWTALNLKLDAHSDVRSVWLQTADSVTICGGGGFIRRSFNGGQTWDFPVHDMHGQISDIHCAGATAFIASNRHRLVMSSMDRGATWHSPKGTTLVRSWVRKLAFGGSMRGNTFGWNDLTPTLYCAIGNQVYRSRDDGETWTSFAFIPNCNRVHGFIVSPKDSNQFVAAVSAPFYQLQKSDDHGVTWYMTLAHGFGEYGIPIASDPDHPDTVYFGGDGDGLYRSVDFGKNWERWSTNVFRSPCDITVVPDSAHIIVLGDGVTGQGQGQYYKSVDWGQTFTLKDTRPAGASEIPGLSNSRLRPNVFFGTNWGSGGVQRSTNFAETWPSASNVTSAWGTDIARDDPNLVIFGTYSGGTTWISTNGGGLFASTPIEGSNYGFYLRDRETVLTTQSSGIYKMAFTYLHGPHNTQSVTVDGPNGGEVWNAGTSHDITWSSVNLALANLEVQDTPGGQWYLIAQVPGNRGRYSWVVPNLPTTTARVRVRDAWDNAPEDSSDATFTVIGTSVGVDDGATTSFALWQNRPNPFTRTTQIGYTLPSETDVDLEVYDLQGQRVARLVRARQGAGTYTIPFGSGIVTASGERIGSLESGVYFYRINAGPHTVTRKMLYLK